MLAQARVGGLPDSSVEGVPGLGSASRQERSAGKGLSVLAVRDRCCPIRRWVRQGIVSAKVISAYARPKKPAQARARESRATPAGEGDHEAQLVAGLQIPAATRGRRCRSRGYPAPSPTALSRPPHAGAGHDGVAPGALGSKGASLRLGNRGIQRVLVTIGWLQRLAGSIFPVESAQGDHASGRRCGWTAGERGAAARKTRDWAGGYGA
jgi:hypothetical protein